MAYNATIKFLGDWRQEQDDAIERDGQLRIDYDTGRLSRCFIRWRGVELGQLQAYVRFYPRGEIISGSVMAPVFDRPNPPNIIFGHKPAPFDLSVPDDATKAEIWFHSFSETPSLSRCEDWDSNFSENYWFDISGPPPRTPAQPVSYRSDALPRPDVVNVIEQSATTVNVFPTTIGGSQLGTDLRTILKVIAWVNGTTYGANAWIDVHVFDGQDLLIHSKTLTMSYAGFDGSFKYEFYGSVYQGTTATPGSVQNRPDACKVQYRIYYEINYQIFTDDILHQIEL